MARPKTKVDLAQLAEQVAWHSDVLRKLGIEPWVNLRQASQVLDIPPATLQSMLRSAEKARIEKRKTPLVYGEHYRLVPVQGGKWQFRVNLPKIQALLNTPPESLEIEV